MLVAVAALLGVTTPITVADGPVTDVRVIVRRR